MLDRFAGTCRGASGGSAGVELGRESSFVGDNTGAGTWDTLAGWLGRGYNGR